MTPLNEGSLDSPDDCLDIGQQQVEYDGNNMAAIAVLLDFLNKRLDVVNIFQQCYSIDIVVYGTLIINNKTQKTQC